MHRDPSHGAGQARAAMRAVLEREAALRAPRMGVDRRHFLGGAMGALAASAALPQLAAFRSLAEAQDGFVPPSEDCYAEVQAAHTNGATVLDWQLIQRASVAQQAAMPDTVLNMLRTLSTLYGGFGVSQLFHMTQTATRARRDNARDELVLLALLHDVGELLTGLNHAEFAAALVRPYVSSDGYHVVRTHMEFQLRHYGDKVLQPTNMRDRYVDQPWYADAATFSDAWDQMSFDPGYATLALADFEPLIRATFSVVPAQQDRPARDCL
jgi:predicted HD phosphohydrolase